MRELRVILAFLAAAATAALAIPLGVCAVLLGGMDTGGASCSSAISFFSWHGIIITLPASLVLGGPLLFVLHRLAWLRWWQVALGGALIGLATALSLTLMDSGFVWYKAGALSALLGFLFGFLSGLVFWLVGVYRNLGPNNSVRDFPCK